MSLEALISEAVAVGVRQALADLSPTTSTEPDTVLTTREAAKLLHLDEQTIRTEAEAGRLPGLLIGRGWKFSRQALLAVLRHPNPTDTAQMRVRQAGQKAV
ncbi:helix-turn-helix domain-containing protein [Deinococcus sp. HMF7620]|uniref:Helix-turn-helix domain-containing protein n=1 Tax=Deinococcus arboris TaxID=2682977 RepID=A0A7C9HRP3_9DEIO|nr:helix-turn-helix domain-containing protein [Deinococcus arboris]MVN86867.1 helix-turn-helix domain-containing protein [Deinococcus arboris]